MIQGTCLLSDSVVQARVVHFATLVTGEHSDWGSAGERQPGLSATSLTETKVKKGFEIKVSGGDQN